MDDDISPIPAPWRDMVMVCGKCSRKLKGGFGRKGKHRLKEALRDALKAAGQRRAVRVVEVGCLSLCPKKAVTVVGTQAPGAVLAVPAGADVEALARQLGAT